MNLKDLLKAEVESAYGSANKLIDLVDDGVLEWKPQSGSNWMTVGQLLHHLSNACGMPMRGFVTGDWGLPDGVDISDLSPEDMLPPAEKMPAVESVEEARRLLAEDKQVALDMIDRCDEETLTGKMMAAPWEPTERALGHHMLQMIEHLVLHKAQLFYYLKLQGKPVNTSHLW